MSGWQIVSVVAVVGISVVASFVIGSWTTAYVSRERDRAYRQGLQDGRRM